MSIQPVTGAIEAAGSPVETGAAGPAAAAQRMQRLQTLIAQIEEGPAGFAAALSTAQASASQSSAHASAPGALAAQTSAPGSAGYPAAALTTSAPGSAGYPAAALTTSAPGSAGYPAAALAAAAADSYPGADAAAYSPVPGVSGTATSATLASPSPASAAGAAGGGSYEALIAHAAARNGVDPAVLHGLIAQESGFDPNATSSAGAVGLTQLMPATAASLGVADPLDPAQSIEGGARYLGEMLREFGGNTEDALAAYNAGPGAVQRYGGVPPYSETRQYVTKVLGYAAQYRARTQPSTIPAASVQGAAPAVIA